uniref:Uncharacterized protein n=1 Tax=Anguilla anguilla TaxID=7936 RepID=A0A0E9SXK2_ANGAN
MLQNTWRNKSTGQAIMECEEKRKKKAIR